MTDAVEKMRDLISEMKNAGSTVPRTWAADLSPLLAELEAEMAALKEPMECGHPKACQYCHIEPGVASFSPNIRCLACEHERLAVAAVLLPIAREMHSEDLAGEAYDDMPSNPGADSE